MLSRRKRELKNNTTIAFAIINSAYRKYKNEQISEAAQLLSPHYQELHEHAQTVCALG